MKDIGQEIDLGDRVKLVYKNPDEFSKYYIIYHGQKYANYYFRKSPSLLLDKARYVDSGYLILQAEKVIGGVLLKPNYMADLFIVPPYNDYAFIGDKVLKYLKKISDNNKNILIQEVLEDYLSFYESRGCVVFEDGFG